MPCAVILTVLPVEYLAVRKHLTNITEEVDPNGTVYERGVFTPGWDVCILEIGAGNNIAALAAERVISYFNPAVILFVGLAGGIKDVAIGDVVASSKIYGYELGHLDKTLHPRPEINLSAYGLEQRARAESRKTDWLKRLSHSNVAPNVFVSPIASGERIVSSTESDVLQFLRSNYGDAVAVEMGGFGFLAATRANPHVSAMVIRGISDIFDDRDNEHKAFYQSLAADNASAFAFEILSKFRLSEKVNTEVSSHQKTNIYISCDQKDLQQARWLYFQLKSAGFTPWMASEDIVFGENVNLLIQQAIQKSDAYLVCISSKSIDTISNPTWVENQLLQAIEISSNRSSSKYLIACILLDEVNVSTHILPSQLEKYQLFVLHQGINNQLQLLFASLKKLGLSKTKKIRDRNLIVSSIELSNIRCFQNVQIDLEGEDNLNYWVMILGDNAIGKSTLLKSIALGLCKESDAVALIKEMPGDFIRKGASEGSIKINLREDKKSQRPRKYSITTKIIKNTEDTTEIVRQETMPVDKFPWTNIFICGYGANRSAQASNSYEQYKVIDAVRSLFDPQAFLQNPEVVLLRQDPSVRAILEEKLQSILMLDTPEYKINYTKRGLEVDGPWGRLPFQVLSDGYRSTTQWVLDFIGWLIYAERLIGNPDIGGILILDEIEQHLHPRWQRYIVQRLRQQFPKTQIIASTHTPLVAAGIADVDRSMLLKLDRNDENEITVRIIDKELIAGKRADQVLTSEAFGLVTTRNNRSHDDVDRYTELLGKQTLTDTEAAELEELRLIVQNRLNNGETAAEQLVEKAVDAALQDVISNVSPEMLDVETKKQLRALFQSEN